MSSYDSIAKKVTKLREQSALTQEEVASKLGIGRQVAQWLAQELGGRMTWVIPDEGIGCRATLSLPAA